MTWYSWALINLSSCSLINSILTPDERYD